jgi:RNA polymerase sigma factor (sigma-70 family)
MDPRQQYVDHLDAINAIAESLCRRNGVRGADAEDFVADVRLKLLQDDCAVFRKFRGGSSTTTFLTVVIANLFRDHRTRLWGKWRPSAEARRRGEIAVQLETAMYRDGQSFEDACGTLTRSGRFRVDRTELKRLLNELPRRVPRPVPDEASVVDDLPASNYADDSLLDREREDHLAAAKAALSRALAQLEPEDQLIIRMHFLEGLSIADVARGLGLEQKPIYPRIRRLLQRLCESMKREGFEPDCLEWLNSTPS